MDPKARVLHFSKLERPANDKNFSLLAPFVSKKENEMLFFVTHLKKLLRYLKARVSHFIILEISARDKHSSFLGPFVTKMNIKYSS